MSKPIHIKNRRASFDYELVEKFTSGIQLTGTEIKSIRDGKASINESYCTFRKNELWVKNMHITEYEKGTIYNHEPKRDRKLLLKSRELKKLESKTKERGFTIIPTLLFMNERGFAKLEIALARGKKRHDKRTSIQERDVAREMDREMKRYTSR